MLLALAERVGERAAALGGAALDQRAHHLEAQPRLVRPQQQLAQSELATSARAAAAAAVVVGRSSTHADATSALCVAT